MPEDGLVKYDYRFGKLRPIEGFRKCGSRLIWDEKIVRNCYFPHGMLLVYVDDDGVVCKLDFTASDSPAQIIHHIEVEGKQPLLVLDSDSKKKLAAIRKHRYLELGVKALGKMEGCLYVYGLGIKKSTDIHLWKEIDRNKKLHTVFVSRGAGDDDAREDIMKLLRTKKNIVFFDQEL